MAVEIETSPTARAIAESRRVANLDLLRVAAITLVVMLHFEVTKVLVWPAALNVFHQGWIGCELLFTLSGWLIGNQFWAELKRAGTVRLGRFWARRLLRILPPYYVALVPIAAAEYATRSSNGVLFDWRYLLLLQNLWGENPIFAHAWFICVQVQFYLLFPLLFVLLRKHMRSFAYVFPVLLVTPIVLRLMNIHDLIGLNYRATYYRSDGLILGMWLAYLANFRPVAMERLYRAAAWLWPAAAAVILWPFSSFFLLKCFFLVGSLCFAIIMLAMLRAPSFAIAKSRPVEWYAAASYSIYLTHVPTLHAYRLFILPLARKLPVIAHLLLGCVLVALVGAAFYLLVERPGQTIRKDLVEDAAAAADGPTGEGHV